MISNSIPGFWKDRNVFVTGGAGFVGSWLVQQLLESGAKVTCLIRDSLHQTNFELLGLPNRVTIIDGSVEDFDLVLRIINEYEIDTIFHLAAQAIVGVANKSPRATFETNIKGTWNVLEAARQLNVQRVVIASSDKAYGTHEQLPYTEEARLISSHPYDVSKTCADLLAQSYHKTYGLAVAITRCGNIFGGGDLNFNRIIPGTIRSLLLGQAPIIRSDGRYLRDYIYVKDAVRAYLQLAENLTDPKVIGQPFNFSGGTPVSVLDLVNQLTMVSGTELPPIILNEAKNEIYSQYLSCEKARTIINWQPKYTIKEGLLETFNWYKNHYFPIITK